MESAKKQVRVVVPLLKAPVTNISDKGFKILIGAQYGSPTTITVNCNTQALDLHDGDLLTIYTEVLVKGATQ